MRLSDILCSVALICLGILFELKGIVESKVHLLVRVYTMLLGVVIIAAGISIGLNSIRRW